MLKRINLRYLGLFYEFSRREHFRWQVIQGTENFFSFWFLRHTALLNGQLEPLNGQFGPLDGQLLPPRKVGYGSG